jgi:hypothetical protein
MATHPKRALRLNREDNSFLSYAVRNELEGASQTFVEDSPVVITAGLIVEAASPATAVIGFAVKAGQNVAGGTVLSEFVPAFPGLTMFGNLLTTAAADHTLADADIGTDADLIKGAILPDGSSAWYFNEALATGVHLFSRDTDYIKPNDPETRAVAGDINARLLATLVDGIRDLGA